MIFEGDGMNFITSHMNLSMELHIRRGGIG